MGDPLIEGTVIENHGALFDVVVDGQTVRCLLRGRLKKDKRREVAPVAAGDRVKITMLARGRGVIEAVLPRQSRLSRRASGSIPLEHTLVANVEQAVIVFAAAEPRTDVFMLDLFLVAAWAAGLERVICINKCDLVDGGPLRARFAVYRQCGYRVLFTSAVGGEGLGELRDVLRERRSAICGPSGVGKSSLLNAIAPGLLLRVGEVGDVTHKGRHTTSSVALLELPFGGWVADTPGLRQLGLWELSSDQIAAAFPDFEPYLGRCRFRDCAHSGEDGCAVAAAVRAGAVHPHRLRSFLQMTGGDT